MEWYVLVLTLSLPSLTQADCSSLCLKCTQRIPNLDTPVNSLTCTLECEGALKTTSELDKCEKAFQTRSAGSTEFNEEDNGERSAPNVEDLQEPTIANLVKRYGGFIKKINKNKIFTSPWHENTILKRLLAKKYGEFPRKLEAPELSEDTEREDVASENEEGVYGNDGALNEVKRYGGFLRKFTPKRSNSAEESSQQELQKRYGGFMRRIRPKFKWDNQKRYGGFLRRHFKISVRSDEEPSYDDFGL